MKPGLQEQTLIEHENTSSCPVLASTVLAVDTFLGPLLNSIVLRVIVPHLDNRMI